MISLDSCSYSASVLPTSADMCQVVGIYLVARKMTSELSDPAHLKCITYTQEQVFETVRPYLEGVKAMASREGIECAVVLMSEYSNKTREALREYIPEVLCTKLESLGRQVGKGSKIAELTIRERLHSWARFPKAAIDNAVSAATMMRTLTSVTVQEENRSKSVWWF